MRKLLKGIAARWAAWRYKRMMRRIRGHFAFFGCPVDHLSDEDIEQAVVRFGRAVARVGLSAEEAARGLQRAAVSVSAEMVRFS